MLEFKKGEFKRGQTIYLTLVHEIERLDYFGEKYLSQTLRDDKGRFHKLKKLSFEDDGQKIGDVIKVNVVAIYPDFSPKIKHDVIPEAHFIELSSFSKAVKSTFNEIAGYSSDDDEFNISNQYEARNGNWVWTFLSRLNAVQKDTLNNYDFDGFKKLQMIHLEVAETIVKGGFLLDYGDDKRKIIKDRLDKIIERTPSILYMIDLVIDSDYAKISTKLIDIVDHWAITDNIKLHFDSNYKLYFLFVKLERFFSNEVIEKILLRVLDFDQQNNNLKIRLNEWSGDRKKRIRTEVFYKDTYKPTIGSSHHLIDNSELKHLIALTEFDYEVYCLREDDNQNSVLLKATLMRFRGYIGNDINPIKEAISYLYDNIGKDTLIEDDFYRDRWRFSFNFELSMCYRFLGKNSSSLDKTIKLFKTAHMYSVKTRSKNQIVDEGFINYFEMAKLIESGKSLKEVKKISQKHLLYYGGLNNKSSVKEVIDNNPFLSQLIDVFKILKSIKFNNDIKTNWGARENMHKLFDYAMEKYSIINEGDDRNQNDRLHASEIAALVLASNLIGDGKHELLKSQLAKVFSKGVVEVQKFSSSEIDVDSDEYKEIQLINLISKVESQTLEFKGSWDLSIDLFTLPKNKRKEHENKWWTQSSEVSRTVASMLNANKGGKLFIGVLENKKKYRNKGFREALTERVGCQELKGGGNLLVGIEAELKAKGWDSDTLIQHINNKLKKDIHESAIRHCIIKSRVAKGKEIIELSISENSFIRAGWWVNDEELPVRENNQINTMRGGTANRWLEEQSKNFLLS